MVNVVDMPIKCPVAPLEFCFLADWYFHERGIRDRVQITYVTPLDGAFTKPVASQQLGGMLAERGIELVTEFNTGEVDGAGGRLVGYDGREVAVRPRRRRAAPRRRRLRRPLTGPRRRARLRADRRAHAAVQGRAQHLRDRRRRQRPRLEGRLGHPLRGRDRSSTTSRRYLAGEPLRAGFDGHANCFIETGFHKALLIDFNYDTEPAARATTRPAVGLPLLKESRLNHLGKLLFQSVLLARPAARPRPPGHRLDHADRRQAPSLGRRRGLTMSTDHHRRAPRSSSTTKASSSTPSSGPRPWPPSSPGARASTSSPTPTGRSSGSCAPSTSPRAPGPTVRVLGKTSGVSVKELYQLFPKGPAKIAAKIAGIPKPRGCI